MASRSACEVEFQALRIAAGQLRDQYEMHLAKATAHLRRKNLGRLDPPERLLGELIHTADLQYAAALVLVTNPTISDATELNLRTLLEAVAQVAFVLGKNTRRRLGTFFSARAASRLGALGRTRR